MSPPRSLPERNIFDWDKHRAEEQKRREESEARFQRLMRASELNDYLDRMDGIAGAVGLLTVVVCLLLKWLL